MDRVWAAGPQQPGPAAGRGGLYHRGRRGDPGVAAAQVLLDPCQVRAHRGGLAVGAERLGQVLVDVGVDGYHRQPLAARCRMNSDDSVVFPLPPLPANAIFIHPPCAEPVPACPSSQSSLTLLER